MPNDPEFEKMLARAQKLSQTSAGKELIRKLNEEKSEQLQSAVRAQDMDAVKRIIREFMSSSQAQEIRRRTEE